MMSQTLESTLAHAGHASRLHALRSLPSRPSAGGFARPKLAASPTTRRRVGSVRAIPESTGATRSSIPIGRTQQ